MGAKRIRAVRQALLDESRPHALHKMAIHSFIHLLICSRIHLFISRSFAARLKLRDKRGASTGGGAALVVDAAIIRRGSGTEVVMDRLDVL